MNFFKKLYCRTYQFFCYIAIPFLPYRTPTLLRNYNELCDALKAADKRRVLIVTDEVLHNIGICDKLIAALADNELDYVIYDGTVANPTTANVAEAVKLYKANQCDCIVAIGGGSAMDCAKAAGACIARPDKTPSEMKGLMKVRRRIPLLAAIPTTAGTGSETTVAAVITDSDTRCKYAINDFSLIPTYALLDSSLTLGLPPNVTAMTGMDALTHAIEAYIGRSTTRETRRNALWAIGIIFDNLYEVYCNGRNETARDDMLFAAYLAGLSFTKSYVGYVHAVAHALGGKYNVAHGPANAVILPRVLDMYGKSVHKKLWKIGVETGLFAKSTSKEVGAKLLIDKINNLNSAMNIGPTLDCISEKDIPTLAKTAEREANPLYPVPRLFTAKDLERLLRETGGLQ